MNDKSKLQFRIDTVLTVLFLITIFFFGIMTVATDFEGIDKAATTISKLTPYLDDPEDYSTWDLLSASIRSVDNYIAGNIYGHTELGYMNSSFQYGLGKRMINTGGQQMITLNSGHLFDLQNEMSMEKAAENIVAMKAAVPEGTPFLFVYEHPTVYSADQMPDGYGVLDYSDEIADDAVSRIREAGIDLLDSREILPASGLELTDYLMVTDQHWATRAALTMAQRITEAAAEKTGIALRSDLLDISQFETETYPRLFLGKYGQRVGTANISPDDITIYWPKYETNITRYTNYLDNITEITGPFRDSVIRWKYLKPKKGKSWNITAYFDYGLVENYDIFTNPDAQDCTILLLKDSYSSPIGSFLSLAAGKVVSVDLRRNVDPLEKWIEEYDPDIVICSYSMQMLRDDNYEFQ